jgi:hypothetical protein
MTISKSMTPKKTYVRSEKTFLSFEMHKLEYHTSSAFFGKNCRKFDLFSILSEKSCFSSKNTTFCGKQRVFFKN